MIYISKYCKMYTFKVIATDVHCYCNSIVTSLLNVICCCYGHSGSTCTAQIAIGNNTIEHSLYSQQQIQQLSMYYANRINNKII